MRERRSPRPKRTASYCYHQTTLSSQASASPLPAADADRAPLDLKALWPKVQDRLQIKLSEPAFQIWIDPLKPLALIDRTLLLEAPPSIRPWVNDRFSPLITQTMHDLLGVTIEVVLRDKPNRPSHSSEHYQLHPRPTDAPATMPRHSPSMATRPTFTKDRYTFDQFVIGESNHLAHTATLTVSELPFQAYNPLFLFGPTGVGKTHLLQAIANYVSTFTPHLTVVYTTLESFTNEFIGALRKGSISTFKGRYRRTDFLLIDDIHFLEGKEQTQEEFFHTFNALYELGSQIVLSSDRPPRDLTLLHSRLQSRFELGLAVDIKQPDYKTRLAVLRKRVATDKLRISDPAFLERIAQRISANIRALEGALIRAVAYSSLTQRPLTAPLADQVISALYGPSKVPYCSVDVVMKAVSEEFHISLDDLCSNRRLKALTYPRHLAMYLSRELTDLSLPRIARAFKRSDHTTVLSASKKVAALAKSDPATRETIRRLKERLIHLSTAPTNIKHQPTNDHFM